MSHLKGIQEIREKILQRKKAMEAASQKASLQNTETPIEPIKQQTLAQTAPPISQAPPAAPRALKVPPTLEAASSGQQPRRSGRLRSQQKQQTTIPQPKPTPIETPQKQTKVRLSKGAQLRSKKGTKQLKVQTAPPVQPHELFKQETRRQPQQSTADTKPPSNNQEDARVSPIVTTFKNSEDSGEVVPEVKDSKEGSKQVEEDRKPGVGGTQVIKEEAEPMESQKREVAEEDGKEDEEEAPVLKVNTQQQQQAHPATEHKVQTILPIRKIVAIDKQQTSKPTQHKVETKKVTTVPSEPIYQTQKPPAIIQNITISTPNPFQQETFATPTKTDTIIESQIQAENLPAQQILSPIAEQSHKLGSISRASVMSEKSDTIQQVEAQDQPEPEPQPEPIDPIDIVIPARKRDLKFKKIEFKENERLRLSIWNLERLLNQKQGPNFTPILNKSEGILEKIQRLSDLVK